MRITVYCLICSTDSWHDSQKHPKKRIVALKIKAVQWSVGPVFTGATTCYFSLAAVYVHSSEASFSFNAWTYGRLSKTQKAPEVSTHRQTLRFIWPPPQFEDISSLNNHLYCGSPPPRVSSSTSLWEAAAHSIFPLSFGVSSLTGGYPGKDGNTDIRGTVVTMSRGLFPLRTSDNSSRSAKAFWITLPSVFLP